MIGATGTGGSASATTEEAVAGAAARLARAGVPEPRADAEVLAAYVLATTRTGLVVAARQPVPPDACRLLEALVARRARREPLHYLVGEREFWSLPMAVDRRVLIPRPDTEVAVETALRLAPGARCVLDVGTGSGAIATALARELPHARVWASDVCRGALRVARANLARHAPDVGLACMDILRAIRPRSLDLIVANLPYVPDREMPTLAPEIRLHEPLGALAGGVDGLVLVRRLVTEAPAALVGDGWLVVEVGMGQAAAVRAWMVERGGYGPPVTVRDAAGIERVVAGRCMEEG
jgi:release factor glutamine methyltransferase